jgi:hypothetical protein
MNLLSRRIASGRRGVCLGGFRACRVVRYIHAEALTRTDHFPPPLIGSSLADGSALEQRLRQRGMDELWAYGTPQQQICHGTFVSTSARLRGARTGWVDSK